MKILTLIFHFLFVLIGSIILVNPLFSKDLNYILTISLIIYGIVSLFFSVSKEIYLKSVPWHICFLILFILYSYQYFFKNLTLINQAQLLLFLTASSTFLAFYFLIDAVFGNSESFKLKEVKITSFQNYYRLNYYILMIVLFGFLLVYYLIGQDLNKISNFSILLIIISFPNFNINFIRNFDEKIKHLSKEVNLNITFDMFGKLAKIRNFVFAKDKFISTENYKIIDSDFRSSVKVLTIMQIANQLANEWNKKYSKLFVLEDYEKNKMIYKIVEKNVNGITVIDDDAVMYHLGNNTYMQQKIKKDESANLFLVKNEIPIAKFKIVEKIDADKIEFLNRLDYFGNTILFYQGMKEDLGKDYSIVFDKTYSGINEKRRIELLSELEKKMPTAFFSTENLGKSDCLCFYITTNADIEGSDNQIICSANNIQIIPDFVEISKKVHTFFKYALLFSLISQIVLLVFSAFNLQRIILSLAILIFIKLLTEIIAFNYKKRIIYLPGQPTSLAQSHQAA
jgi:hypothetical protein